MSKTMKAVLVKEFGKPLEVAQVSVPKPNRHEILVKIMHTGFCGTDHHAWKGDWDSKPKLPLIPGHEGVGKVVEVGDDVTTVQVGDIVGIAWLHDACGNCEYCFTGWETLCQKQHNSGYSVMGTMAEYAIGDPNYVAKIPDGVDLKRVAPILCAGVTVYKGLKVTDARPGQWVMVSGLGGLGQLAIQFGVAMGFNMIGVDINDEKLERAKSFGAKYVYNGKTEDVAALVQEKVGGVHGCLVTAVSAAAYSQALGAIRRHGTLSMIGLPSGTFPLDIVSTVMKGITIRGSIVGTRIDMVEALQFFAEGKIHNEVDIEPLDNADHVMHLMDEGKLPGRVVFDLTQEKETAVAH